MRRVAYLSACCCMTWCCCASGANSCSTWSSSAVERATRSRASPSVGGGVCLSGQLLGGREGQLEGGGYRTWMEANSVHMTINGCSQTTLRHNALNHQRRGSDGKLHSVK